MSECDHRQSGGGEGGKRKSGGEGDGERVGGYELSRKSMEECALGCTPLPNLNPMLRSSSTDVALAHDDVGNI